MSFEYLEITTAADSPKTGIITLKRPPLNALNFQLQQELLVATKELEVDRDIKAVIVTGGDKVFAAGADVKEMQNLTAAEMQVKAKTIQSALSVLANLTKPTAAAICGYALGGGLELALGADIRIAADTAKLGFPEILLGIIPGGGGTQRLARLIGITKAKELIFTGKHIDSIYAKEIGLVDIVVDADAVLTEAITWAKQFESAPTLALSAAKKSIDLGIEKEISAGLQLEQELFSELFDTRDQKIGMQSFLTNGPGKAEFVGN